METNVQTREIQQCDMHRVLELALEAGRVLLKNGAEIFRVEETIRHICASYRVEKVDVFTMSNGIFITAVNEDKEVFARVKHVPLSGTHLGIVTEVNDLSREISAGKVGLEEAFERLHEIEKMPSTDSIVRILASGIGCASFGFLLKANVWEAMLAFVIGVLLYIFVIFSEKNRLSKIIVNILGGAFITVCTIAFSMLPLPFSFRIDKVIICSILPLVPGVAFVNAIRDIVDSDFLSGMVRMIDALLVFVYIAIGVGTALSIFEGLLGGVGL